MFSLFPRDAAQLADPMEALASAGRMLLGGLILSVFGIVFFAGYGHMLAEAAVTGRTSHTSFFPGIKNSLSVFCWPGSCLLLSISGFR